MYYKDWGYWHQYALASPVNLMRDKANLLNLEVCALGKLCVNLHSEPQTLPRITNLQRLVVHEERTFFLIFKKQIIPTLLGPRNIPPLPPSNIFQTSLPVLNSHSLVPSTLSIAYMTYTCMSKLLHNTYN